MKPVSPDTTIQMQSLAPLPVPAAPSVFGAHHLRAGREVPVMHRSEQPDWVFGVLALCFILVAWMMVSYRKRLLQLISAAFSRRFLSQLSREGDLLQERIALALGLIYVLTFSMVVYQWNEIYFNLKVQVIDGYFLYIAICLFFLLYWTVKIVAMKLLSIVFKTPATNHEYLLNVILITSLTGLSLLPFLVFTVYLKSVLFLTFCIVLIIGLFIYRFIKGLFIGITLTRFSYLFLFVYLCGLELLPLIVMIKLVLSYFVLSV
jgi:hypothetical protein